MLLGTYACYTVDPYPIMSPSLYQVITTNFQSSKYTTAERTCLKICDQHCFKIVILFWSPAWKVDTFLYFHYYIIYFIYFRFTLLHIFYVLYHYQAGPVYTTRPVRRWPPANKTSTCGSSWENCSFNSTTMGQLFAGWTAPKVGTKTY